MKTENGIYDFIESQLIGINKVSKNCALGDIIYYKKPYLLQSDHAEIQYVMPHNNKYRYSRIMDFYSDLNDYWSKTSLGA